MKNVAKARLLVTRFPYESRLGGEEMHTIALMKGLDDLGYEAFFMGSDEILLKLFGEAGFKTKKRWLAKPPVTFWRLMWFTALSPILFFWAGWMIWQARRNWKVDVFYALSLGEKLMITPWAKFFGMKILWLEHARFGNWMSKNPWRGVYKFLSRWVLVVVTSNAMKPFAQKFARNVEAISCGVIVDKKSALPDKISAFCKNGFCVGTVARLTVDKGVDMIAKLVHNKPDVRLIIIGDGPMKTDIEKQTKSGQILLLPSLPRPQLMTLFESLDLFVLGSREMDPFGMVAAEAMWHGTPVLMTNVCGISKDLAHQKEAWICEPRFAEIDRAFKHLKKQTQLRREIANRGRTFARENYSMRKELDRFVKLF